MTANGLWVMAGSSCIELTADERRCLLVIARQSVERGIAGEAAVTPADDSLPPALHRPAAVFVTLYQRQRLRGCIGSLEPEQSMAAAVADAARSAALRDPRFPAVEPRELEDISLEIAVLSALSPLFAETRDQLLASLQPGIDGLLLEDGNYRATFLPKVWTQLPTPDEFFENLLLKAGLPAAHWSPSLRFQRYGAESFADDGGYS